MLDIKRATDLVNDICFELDIKHYKFVHKNIGNITKLKEWFGEVVTEYKDSIDSSATLSELVSALESLIKEHDDKPPSDIPRETMKSVYIQLVEGLLVAPTIIDEFGYYKLEDGELTDLPDMANADIRVVQETACTTHFIEGMIEKYKPNEPQDLYNLFERRKGE